MVKNGLVLHILVNIVGIIGRKFQKNLIYVSIFLHFF